MNYTVNVYCPCCGHYISVTLALPTTATTVLAAGPDTTVREVEPGVWEYSGNRWASRDFISLIKAIRTTLGCGLKEAKDIWDNRQFLPRG
jgi:ribosomal protein L7/L12